jgi:hypothetical protein
LEDFIPRLLENLGGRIDGPMSFRFILQPAMAILFGVLDGLRYAREGRTFLLWGGPTDPVERRAQQSATWKSIGKVFALAVVLDVVYQAWVLQWIYPLEALIVAVVVALIPYFLVRFTVNTFAKRWRNSNSPDRES